MSLLYFDGFEAYGTTADLATSGTGNTCYMSSYTTGTTVSSAVYRTEQVTVANSRSVSFTVSAGFTRYITFAIPSTTEVITGVAFRHNITGTGTYAFLVIAKNNPATTAAGICIAINFSTGALGAYVMGTNGNVGALLGTATGTYLANQWHYFEVRSKLGTTTGEVQIYANGTEVLNITAVNTATGPITDYTTVTFLCPNNMASGNIYYDDFYIANTSGSVNNTFLGPLSVYTQTPTANGSTNDLSPIGAGSNWQAVSEQSPDTTTYIETTTTGHKDYFTFEALPAGVTDVKAVMLKAKSTTADNGLRKLRMNLKNGVSTISSSLRSLLMGTWTMDTYLSETAPDGTAWTKTNVDSSEAGVEAQE